MSGPLILPKDWDASRDFLVLVNHDELTHKRLSDLKQERQVLFAAPLPPEQEQPFMRLLADEIRDMKAPFPNHFYVSTDDDALTERIYNNLRDWISRKAMIVNTIEMFKPLWRANVKANLGRIAKLPSIEPLVMDFPKMPAIMVSPGPSLSKNVAELKGVQGRALIVCLSHALRPLLNAGVEPDLVILADPQEHLEAHFEGILSAEYGAAVMPITAHPKVFARTSAGRTFIYMANSKDDHWTHPQLEDVYNIACFASVATAMFSLLYAMGCDPIIMVGQDLSFADDGKLYDDASAEKGNAHDLGEAAGKLVRVPGYRGGVVLTTEHYNDVRKWFSAVVAKSGRRVINATEGGAAIGNTYQEPLFKVVANLPPRDPSRLTPRQIVEQRFRLVNRKKACDALRKKIGRLK